VYRCLPPSLDQAEASGAKQVAALPALRVTGGKRRRRLGHLPPRGLHQLNQALAVNRVRPRKPAFEPPPCGEHLRREAGAVAEREHSRYVAVGKRSKLLGEALDAEERRPPVERRVAHEPAVLAHQHARGGVPINEARHRQRDRCGDHTQPLPLRIDDIAACREERSLRIGFEQSNTASEQSRLGQVVGSAEIDDRSARQHQPAVQGRNAAEVAAVAHKAEIGMAIEKRRRHRDAVIGRGVVNDDDLIGGAGLGQQRLQRRVQISPVVVAWNDHAQHRSRKPRRSHSATAPCIAPLACPFEMLRENG
jgi:hypothetical protein